MAKDKHSSKATAKANQKGAEKIIKSHGGKPIKGRDKTFDMSDALAALDAETDGK